MPTLGRINVTPVKGMALLHPERVQVTPAGIPGSRRFFLVDEHGGTVAGDRVGTLVRIRATYDLADSTLTLRFPDGSEAAGPTDRLGDPVVSDFYGRAVAGHEVQGPWNEALSGYVGRPVRLVRTDRDGDGVDVLPLTLVSTASIRDLGERGGHEGPLDGRRFRMNLELEGCEPYDEDGWDGATIGIGEAELRIDGPVPRCVVTTHDPDLGTKDWNTLAQIAKQRARIPDGGGLPFGMYATVVRPGTVRVGDPVSLP